MLNGLEIFDALKVLDGFGVLNGLEVYDYLLPNRLADPLSTKFLEF